MTTEQIILFALMGSVLALLVWGRWRYDLVAFTALVVGVVVGVIPKDAAFEGFGHPAVIIIALVLIVSRALSQSGAVDLITGRLVSPDRSVPVHIALIGTVGAALSAFMNNVAALALLMPVDIQAATRAKRAPSMTLMALSFCTILGGMATLIGTPPNIVIAQVRQRLLGEPYQMFDFTPVGLACAIAGLAFIAFVGWRLVPQEASRGNSARELENLEDYVAEIGIGEGSEAIGKTVRDLLPIADDHDVYVLGLVRSGKRLPGTAINEEIRKSDSLVVEAGPEAIESFAGALKLNYSRSSRHSGPLAGTLSMTEAVVAAGSRMEGRSAHDLRLLYRHNTMLLGVARSGRRFRDRVRHLKVAPGDVLLLLGPKEHLPEVVAWLGALPLAERGLQVAQRQKAGFSIAIFLAAIVLSALGWIYLPVALGACAALYVLLRVITLSQLYEAIEWPVIVLLASLIPIGTAIEKSGGTELIAGWIVTATDGWPAWGVLVLLMVVTMSLSDVLNNVATVLVAAPVGIDVARKLSVNPDAMLMGVAVAASCAFLSPIGHKNNTIIMGPGGYRFGDYWRMGLPLELLIIAVAVPVILLVWGL